MALRVPSAKAEARHGRKESIAVCRVRKSLLHESFFRKAGSLMGERADSAFGIGGR